MEPLHLTAANRECLRELVRKITPDFEEKLWAEISFRKAEEERKIKEAAEALKHYAQMQAGQAQQNTVTYGQYGNAVSVGSGVIYTGSTNITTTTAPCSLGGTVCVPAQANPIYVSQGTGFSTYDPQAMGLGKAGGGWTK